MIKFYTNLFHSFKALRTSEISYLGFLTFMVLLTGTLFYHWQEGWSYLDSFYFSVITLTTIGYGDFSPVTDAGKLFTIGYVFCGIGILVAFLSTAGKAMILHQIESLKKDPKK